jgi:uncharacterized membrane protein YdcZ (DUF606 family)
MTPQILLALVAVAIGGACISTQAPINARLAGHVGGPMTAAAISFLVAFLVLGALTLLRGGLPSLAGASAAPWWAWVGCALGASTLGRCVFRRHSWRRGAGCSPRFWPAYRGAYP